MDKFPHMDDTEFPYVDQVDVWKFKNDFDYKKFADVQMRITVCAVPWDVGLIHVGNAQIGGLGNVVDFGSEEARDAWFSSIEDKHIFETEYRKFHMEGKSGSVDGTIRVPIPYDVIARYNYAIVEYTPLPVNLEGTGVRKWFYFIRESKMVASSTTEVELILDAWMTFVQSGEFRVSYMMLERGHAPLASLSADEYLTNPMEHTRYVTGDDVNYDDNPSIVRSESEIVFNDGESVYACMVMDSILAGDWGTYRESWRMPATHRQAVQGVPNYDCYALPAEQINDFLLNVDAHAPQLKQSIKAIFFATEKTVNLGEAVSFMGLTFYYVNATQQQRNLLTLDKESFGYDARYADIAKLYTWPYAHIEIMDELGDTSIVRVEDTTGTLDVASSLSIVFPFINLTAHVLGVGGASRRNITFRNIGGRNFRYGGKWQDTVKNWNIPTFAAVQSNDVTYDYSTYYDRVQMENDADTAKLNAYASALTAQANADDSALVAKLNANASAANAKTNADARDTTSKANNDASAANAKTNADASATTAKTNADNSAANTKTNADSAALVSKTNADNSADTAHTNAYLQSDASYNNSVADADTINANAALDVLANNANRATIAEYNSLATQTSTATTNRNTIIANDLTNDLMVVETAAQQESASISAIGSAVGGILSLSPISGASNAIQTTLQAAVSIHAAEAEAALQMASNSSNATSSNITANTNALNATARAGEENSTENSRITAQAANTASTAIANATRTRNANKTAADNTKATDNTNAANTYGADTVINANNKNVANTNAANTYATDTGINANNKNTANANAQRTYDTEIAANARDKDTSDANAQRTYDNAVTVNQRTKDTAYSNATHVYENALDKIDNLVRQAKLEPTNTFGDISNAETATTRPLAMFAQVVTQNDGAIASAGDEMLRFGYHCNMAWEFDGWQLMKNFTYWKVSDLWIDDFRLPDAYADRIRFTLMGGVCVWRSPDIIGKTSIYDN